MTTLSCVGGWLERDGRLLQGEEAPSAPWHSSRRMPRGCIKHTTPWRLYVESSATVARIRAHRRTGWWFRVHLERLLRGQLETHPGSRWLPGGSEPGARARR